MSKSIRISPKYGVNPCIPICAFCGQQKNEVALLGRLKHDAEAPGEAIINYEPCEQCIKNWSQGVALIRVTTVPPENGMPPFMKDNEKMLYLTGQYCVITPNAAKRIFDLDAQTGDPILIDASAFDSFMETMKEQGILNKNGNVL